MSTKVPVTLIDPTGSSSGQAIVSSGSSSAPAWSNVPIANVTGGAPLASPSFTGAVTITNSAASGSTLSISATSDATNGAQIFLAGNGATTPNKYIRVLSGILGILDSLGTTLLLSLDNSGNLITNGSITTSQTAGIIGTTTNNNANAGSVGEYMASATNAAAITSNTATNVTSLSLTAGDWDVTGSVLYLPQSGDTLTSIQTAINTTSATIPSWTSVPYQIVGNLSITAGGAITGHVTPVRFSLSTTTTVYLVSLAIHSGGTCNTQGYLRARRLR